MNLKKIKEILRSKTGMIATGVVLGALVIGIATSVMINGSSKESGKVENNKQVTVNKDDNKNKTDKEQEKIKEEVNKKEHSNTLTEDKNEEVVKQEDKKENEVASAKEENSTSNNNSKVETNNSTSKPSNTTNNTSSNKPQSNEKPSAPVNIHTHSWQEVYKDVAHSEEGHWEDVLVSPAWTEEVPVYEEQARSICNGCGKDITGSPWDHIEEQALAGNFACGGYHVEYIEIQVGTNTINHDAVYEKKWVVDKSAWTEKVLTGHQCSCGATK
ncbi:MAG: hypothetical protein E7C47_09670 [Veillonella sp.]|uniref:hypothetical protein n=1 Tax=Veillonella sp. TaxID=1926307 RepID=UPI002901F45E|nr:hypothetical protein [Veillonella sp.]MDU2702395.1 hypothetical protein [Veillonella sp.]